MNQLTKYQFIFITNYFSIIYIVIYNITFRLFISTNKDNEKKHESLNFYDNIFIYSLSGIKCDCSITFYLLFLIFFITQANIK